MPATHETRGRKAAVPFSFHEAPRRQWIPFFFFGPADGAFPFSFDPADFAFPFLLIQQMLQSHFLLNARQKYIPIFFP